MLIATKTTVGRKDTNVRHRFPIGQMASAPVMSATSTNAILVTNPPVITNNASRTALQDNTTIAMRANALLMITTIVVPQAMRVKMKSRIQKQYIVHPAGVMSIPVIPVIQ